MEAFVIYLLKSAVATTAFYLFYILAFRAKKQFRFNRIYLISSMAISLLLPLIRFTVQRPQAANYPILFNTDSPAELPTVAQSVSLVDQLYLLAVLIFALGFLLLLIKLVVSNWKAIQLTRRSESRRVNGLHCLLTDDTIHPFTFFNKIIIPTDILNKSYLDVILEHENIHVKEHHTRDVLFAELLLLFQWFNPFAWLMRQAIKNNLEYLTDDIIIRTNNRQSYQLAMVAMADKEGVAPFLTALNGSQLKQRIIKMKQKTDSKKLIGKKLLVLPLLTLLVLLLANKKFEAAPITQGDNLVSGTVYINDAKQPLPGATVLIKNSTVGTITDMAGKFVLKVNELPATLQFSFAGTDKQEVTVDKSGSIEVTLTGKPDQVVSIRSIPQSPLLIVDGKPYQGSMDDINPDQIDKIEVYKGAKATAIYGTSAQDGAVIISLKDPKLIKSVKSKTQSALPLIVLNGEEKGNVDIESLNIDPTSIESIDVLKNESSTRIYGDKGTNGVIVITTKK